MPHLSRVHGDYHVGQILLAGRLPRDRLRGEPTGLWRSGGRSTRRFATSPRCARSTTCRSGSCGTGAERRARREWAAACRASFLQAYARPACVSYHKRASLDHSLLRAFEAEKAAYEFAYAESFLPEWLPIATAGAELLLSREVGE